MAHLFKDPEQISAYKDRRFVGTQDEFEQALQTSTTVYVGNLSFYTTEEQIYELFSRCGEIKKIVMGLDKNNKTPCGFCFLVYYTREDCEDSVKYVSGTILDDRPIRVDFDWGFQDGRQWGRGRSGGQVRDEYRTDYDPDVEEDMESLFREIWNLVGNSWTTPHKQQRRPYLESQGIHMVARKDHMVEGTRVLVLIDRKRRRDEERIPADGVKKSGDRDNREKNPRFREKGDSDEEDNQSGV